jgi:hypothetical protein
MEIISILLAIVIGLLSIWILLKLNRYGGFIGAILSKIGYGTIILGLSQIIETPGLNFFNLEDATMDMVHHLVFIVGLSLIAWGFRDLLEKK